MPVREVSIADHFEAALPLMRRNWVETGMAFEFLPDRSLYERMQEAGALLALGAFHDEQLVGYATAVVTPHHFNPQVQVCVTDALFVEREHRTGVLPGRLILGLERLARQRGARWAMWHTRADTPLAQTMRAHGYRDLDTVMGKEL